jgi:hypothetical protein
MKLADLRPVLELPGLRFVSLQVGEDAEQIMEFSNIVEDYRCRISDFGDTAALMSTLDLIITIDTAVAHLAGALGLKAWVMLKYAADWRWFTMRNDSPWYSNFRLFRQEHETSLWGGVIRKIAKELDDLSARSL